MAAKLGMIVSGMEMEINKLLTLFRSIGSLIELIDFTFTTQSIGARIFLTLCNRVCPD